METLDLHAAYVRERMGAEVESERGKGFAVWKMLAPSQQETTRAAYLIDIYVSPDYRPNGVASKLTEQVAAKAKAQGAKRLLGSVETLALTRTDATRAILAAGFAITHIEGTVIWFAKEIG